MIADSLTTKQLAVTMAGALVLPTASTAEAGSRHRHDAGAAIAAGVIGLAAGTIVGSALAAPRPAEPVYVGRPYPVYAPPPPVYAPAPVYHRELVVQYSP